MIPYILKSFRGGISDENDKGPDGSFKYGYGLEIHGRDDSLSCKQAMTTVFGASNTTQTGITNFFVNASNGTTYCFGSTGSIFARSGDGQFTFVYNDENGAIKGATEWQLSDGVDYLFWATATSVARKVLEGSDSAPDSGSARWTDVTADWKTTLDNTDWHTMQPASGSLMIGNNNNVARIDYDGEFNALALDVRPGNVIKALEERDDYLILGSGRKDKSEEGFIWSWITTAINWIQKKRIPVKGINSMINTEFLLMQGGSDGELFFSDFVNAQTLHGIIGGGQTDPGGVTVDDDLASFGFYGGDNPGIWTYGRKRKNRSLALNYPYRLSQTVVGSTISTISAVTTADGTLLASWGTTDGSTSEYGIDSVTSTTKATALYEGLEFNGGSPHLKKGFNTVVLVLAPLPAGTSVSVKYKLDKLTAGGDSSAGAGWKYAVMGNGATTFSETNATEAVFPIGGRANTYEVGVELNPSVNETPNVEDVITYVDKDSYDFT